MMVDIATTEPKAPANKKWYVVHTYSGYEQRAKTALEERVRALNMSDKIGEIVVPVAVVVDRYVGTDLQVERAQRLVLVAARGHA